MSINFFSHGFSEPVNNIGIAEAEGKIVRVAFNFTNADIYSDENARFVIPGVQNGKNGFASVKIFESETIKLAFTQFSEYFDGGRAAFELPFSYAGAAFTMKVYRELLGIPAGETRSYADIAEACGNSKACRAVGMINGNNPLPFIIPCHRVIGSDGSLTGYAGGLPMKRYLLELEKRFYGHAA